MDQTRAQFFPRFYVQAGHILQQNKYAARTQWFAIFGMNWNIFSGLDTKAPVSQAKLKVQQLKSSTRI